MACHRHRGAEPPRPVHTAKLGLRVNASRAAGLRPLFPAKQFRHSSEFTAIRRVSSRLAHRLGLSLPPEWSALIRKHKTVAGDKSAPVNSIDIIPLSNSGSLAR
jgi:hypothetical protein